MEVKEKVVDLIEEEKDRLDDILAKSKEYVETRIDLIAINIQDRLTDILSSVVAVAILWVFGIFSLSMLSVGIALSISEYYKDPPLGFYWVGGSYFLIGMIVYIKRRDWIKLPITNILLTKINFHEED
jgi:hypothetical protein